MVVSVGIIIIPDYIVSVDALYNCMIWCQRITYALVGIGDYVVQKTMESRRITVVPNDLVATDTSGYCFPCCVWIIQSFVGASVVQETVGLSP